MGMTCYWYRKSNLNSLLTVSTMSQHYCQWSRNQRKNDQTEKLKLKQRNTRLPAQDHGAKSFKEINLEYFKYIQHILKNNRIFVVIILNSLRLLTSFHFMSWTYCCRSISWTLCCRSISWTLCRHSISWTFC